FEMHSCLVEPHHGDVIYEYYRNIKEKLIKDDDNSFGYHFSDEDFYIYCIAHEYKHFAGTGTGLRSLADTYVMLQKFGDDLDWSYINNELNKLGISDFERNNRELTLALFSGKELSAEQKKLLDYHIFSGTYGVIEHRIQNRIGKNASVLAKLKYAANRAKVPEGDMKEFHPFFYKHKSFRPLLYAKKVIKKLLFNSRPMIREIKALFK
ncbi:MAG: nucleotidyltransferase family protein, partial [Ruminococcus sp.]|nr:nucleotidyltransferase family protein [Ruminococcus sp.]